MASGSPPAREQAGVQANMSVSNCSPFGAERQGGGSLIKLEPDASKPESDSGSDVSV
jgi:hypothetical protein